MLILYAIGVPISSGTSLMCFTFQTMGIRGLSTYIHEHLHEVLVKHKLHHRKVVIDGNNLAHILYFECTGINAAFGGDYDKYSSFVEEFFKG